MEILRKYKGGLIALSACLAGEIPKALLAGDFSKAEKIVNEYKELFDEFYIEIQDHGIEEQKKVNPLLVKLAKATDTPLVATNDVHYIKSDDAKNQDVLLCIQTGKTLDTLTRDVVVGGTNVIYAEENSHPAGVLRRCHQLQELLQVIQNQTPH